MDITQAAQLAKKAAIKAAAVDSQTKNKALAAIKQALLDNADQIIKANQADIAQAQKDNLALPLLKRLKFDESKIKEVCDGIDSLIKIPDPIGKTLSATELDEGLELYKVSCPIGVIGVIF
jgi:glutamate-5-semialdehyde dehydrogenase